MWILRIDHVKRDVFADPFLVALDIVAVRVEIDLLSLRPCREGAAVEHAVKHLGALFSTFDT